LPQSFLALLALEEIASGLQFANGPDWADQDKIQFSVGKIAGLAHNYHIVFYDFGRDLGFFDGRKRNQYRARVYKITLH
jgi:hypothetical protein